MTVNGPYSDVPAHEGVTAALDYEGELGVVISKKGIDIPVGDAGRYIFGYTVINDVTARDLQQNHMQWYKGKSLDGFCPSGPWIVTSDEIPDAGGLAIRTTVNGEIRQDSNTSKMIFGIPELISQLSQGHTLLPGDILATGTPSGVGMGYEPPRFLKKGDTMTVEIEKIGLIRNRIV
jgi:2-keto-4-pentenoate hydratase/2-oxohepta-3-ene-1,7-dioic acid hydratase in catechol pathway